MCRFPAVKSGKLHITPAATLQPHFRRTASGLPTSVARAKYQPFVSSVKNLFSLQIDAKGKNLYDLSNGRIGKIDLGSKKTNSIAVILGEISEK